MKVKKEDPELKRPKVVVNPRLDEFDNKIHFPEKHAKAKEIFARVGLPKTK